MQFMEEFRLYSASEQVASYLRSEIGCGKIRGELCGSVHYAAKLGVNTKTEVVPQNGARGLLMK